MISLSVSVRQAERGTMNSFDPNYPAWSVTPEFQLVPINWPGPNGERCVPLFDNVSTARIVATSLGYPRHETNEQADFNAIIDFLERARDSHSFEYAAFTRFDNAYDKHSSPIAIDDAIQEVQERVNRS